MKLKLLLAGITASVSLSAASGVAPTQLGVIPEVGNGIIPWSTLQNYVSTSQFMANNFSGFQYYSNGNYYYVGDNKLAAFKTACGQSNGSVTIKEYTSGQWQDTTVPAATIAQALLHSTRMGSLVFTGQNYQPLSTLFNNTGYNNLQLNMPLIEQSMTSSAKPAALPRFNAYYLESIPYMYAALIQNYIGRVYTGATALQPLFNVSGVYNGQTINNTLILQNFLAACTYALACNQYALGAFSQPNNITQGLFSPNVQTATNQSVSPSTLSESSVSPYGNTSGLGFTNNENGSTASSPATVVPQQGATMSLLDTFAGIIVINNVPTVTTNGVTYNAGFGPESLTLVNGTQPIPTPKNPNGVVFSGQSGFIPVTGSVDDWSPVSNGVTAGRSVGINYTIYSNQPTSSVAYGSSAATFTVTLGANENIIEIYANDTMTGSPVATLNLANFFVIPTPWALVINVAGFITAPNAQVTTPCVYITPAALTSSTQTALNQYINQQLQNGSAPSACVNFANVLCQSNNQPVPQTPDVLGVVKLNSYDFPFQFTQATTIVTPQYSTPNQNQTSTASTAQTGLPFSMQDIYNSAAAVYARAFPDNFHMLDARGNYKNITSFTIPSATGTYKPYAFGYLMLQGLCNGYLMMSQATAPLITPLQAPYSLGTDLGKNITGLTSLATQYPQPTEVEWFAAPGFDYLMVRSLMVMRYFVRTMYIRAAALPYIQQIIKNPELPYQPVDKSGKPTGSVVYFGQNSVKSYYVYAPAQLPKYETVTVCATTSTPSTSSIPVASTQSTGINSNNAPAF